MGASSIPQQNLKKQVGNPPVADEVDDDLDYLKQPLAVPPDPFGEIELHSSFSSSDFISLGDHHLGWLKSNFPQQYSKPVIAFERPQFKTKTGPALEEDISYFDDLFSVGLPSPPQERKTDQKLQSPLKDYGTRGNIYVENEHKHQQQCLANVENIDKRVEHNKDKNKQYFYTKSIGDVENCINFINDDNELEGMESNILLANKKIGSKRGWSKSKQQEQWSRNFGSGDENEPFNYMSKKRMCSHCKAEKTPQWRVGPLGPKTLCNACGVRYKSGRLVPGYRPAASPTFDTSKHSNFHRKIIKRRDDIIL